MSPTDNPRQFLESVFQAAIASAQPRHNIPPYLPENRQGKLTVIGAGKASAAMAQAVEQHWEGELSGLVVTRYGYAVACRHIDIVEAAHPVPDASGLAAAQRMISLVSELGEEDTVLCLISGGGSSLLPLPYPGITLEEKQSVNRELLKCGATISEMNCVRRHLSAIKGGKLAAACYPARLITLLISDVPGDDPADIASGPTSPDATTCGDALAVIDRYGISLAGHIRQMLESGESESLNPDDPRLTRNETHLISTPLMALEAAANQAAAQGLPAYILSDRLEGEAREVGKVMAGIALQVSRHDHPFPKPCLLLSGGETTVTVRGNGRGGRNVEFLLSMGIQLNGEPGIYALAGDTDGVDGQEEIAGAFLAPDTLFRARALDLNAKGALDNNDGHGFFETIGASVVTGPTLTNVNDFRCVLIC
ncbi:glycerate kinase type-2 family protein [Serratia ficaria]|uniref:glycerate kinase type-2 family protein n=1 Tax=Serratia ficaria TaxID=61651 RepID=UPI0021776E84|nr:glycerate kinase [Serratia ficaria]CAI0796844.1 MOFRL family [Serratia ficaria]CAI1662283.1 MOFRL family [Serratia ficaria]